MANRLPAFQDAPGAGVLRRKPEAVLLLGEPGSWRRAPHTLNAFTTLLKEPGCGRIPHPAPFTLFGNEFTVWFFTSAHSLDRTNLSRRGGLLKLHTAQPSKPGEGLDPSLLRDLPFAAHHGPDK